MAGWQITQRSAMPLRRPIPRRSKTSTRGCSHQAAFTVRSPRATGTWNTKSGKATFIVPVGLDEDPDEVKRGDVLQLITLRSNDQFNTTVYGYDDRFRGIRGTRMVLLMNAREIARFGLADGQQVTLSAFTKDNIVREVEGFRIHTYAIPDGCVGGYYPECNPLIPLWHHAERSKVPAAKSVPVVIKTASGELSKPRRDIEITRI